jgi:exo-beta-1,3-glucanase (GH17 family)
MYLTLLKSTTPLHICLTPHTTQLTLQLTTYTANVHAQRQAYTALLARLNTNKPVHIGEVGWPSSVTEYNQTEPLTGTYSDYTAPVFHNAFTRTGC